MKTKKLLSIILTLAMVLSLLPMTVSVSAESTQEHISFRYYNKDAKVMCNTKWTGGYTSITSSTKSWTTGWYVAEGEITIDGRVSVTGDVKLILTDGCKLTVNGGINVAVGQSFTIFAQSEGTGSLIADVGSNTHFSSIGGGDGASGGTVKIHGGIVTAQSNDYGAGIGGGYRGNGGLVEIYSGSVVARSCLGYGAGNAAGIGGGEYGNGGTVNIYGGSVTAICRTAVGIGAGYNGNGGTITVDGNIRLFNSSNGAEYTKSEGQEWTDVLGGGSVSFIALPRQIPYLAYDKETGKFTEQICDEYKPLTEGVTTLTTGYYVAGGNYNFGNGIKIDGDVKLILMDRCFVDVQGINVIDNNRLTIYAQSTGKAMGTITSQGNNSKAGIGGDWGENCGTVIIHGGRIEAKGDGFNYFGSAGIGGGSFYGNGGTVEIYGGTVTAQGGEWGAGIGGGSDGNGGVVNIYGGNVTATGVRSAAGIGGGSDGNGGVVNIYGGNVIATGNAYASIGRGKRVGSHGTLTVSEKLNVINYETKETIKASDIPNYQTVSLTDPEFSEHTQYKKYENGEFVTETCEEDPYYPYNPWSGAVWNDDWYEIDGKMALDTVTVKGDVNLILKDDCELTVTGGINVPEGSSLTIYAQSEGKNQGRLIVKGANNSAGIGGAGNKNGGNITIHGGNITAIGNGGGAGIGGGSGCASHGGLTVADGLIISAGAAAGDSASVTAGEYKTNRNGYVFIHHHDFSDQYGANDAYTHSIKCTFCDVRCEDGKGNHTFTDGVCSVCQYECQHNYVNLVCTICGKLQKTYIDHSWDSTKNQVISTKKGIPETAQEITADTTTLSSGWYTVDGEVTVDGRITVSGDVNLILQDGCKLEVKGGINVSGENSLNIYAQSDTDNMGSLIAGSNSGTTVISGNAGIGGDANTASGNITVHGGRITATGSENGAGIGSGIFAGSDSNITIYNGIITATGGKNAAGIGGGAYYSSNVTIYNGNITATGGDGGAGIGGGLYAGGGNVTVYNGKITATGGYRAAGIGGGNGGESAYIIRDGGTLTVHGGDITATGSDGAAGIGGGYNENGGTVTVNGGDITATGGVDAAGIGGGYFVLEPGLGLYGDGGTVTVNGGNITATGKGNGAGIGGGCNGDGNTFIMTGGVVSATGEKGAGIGGGYNGYGSDFIFSGGCVTAVSANGTGIGVGYNGGSGFLGKHEFTVADGTGIKAGDTAANSSVTTATEYAQSRKKYVSVHLHDYTGEYKNNGDGTHSRQCAYCDVVGTTSEEHSYTGEYKDNGDSTHSRQCAYCDAFSAPEEHSFVDHICACGATNAHSFTGNYVDNGDGTHSQKCIDCEALGAATEHTVVDGKCTLCDFQYKTITLSDGTEITYDDTKFVIDDNGILTQYKGSDTVVVIPEGVKQIGNQVFQNNKTIKEVNIPASVEIAGEYAFYRSSLTTVKIEKGSHLTTISDSAFRDAQLTSFTVPASVKTIDDSSIGGMSTMTEVIFEEGSQLETIGSWAFNRDNLTTINIPKTVKSIGREAFVNNNTFSSVYVNWTEASEIVSAASDLPQNTYSSGTLYVPKGTKDLYKNHELWGKFQNIVEMEPEPDSLSLTVTGKDFKVTPIGEDTNKGVIIVALYDSEDMNRLLDVKVFDIENGDEPEGTFTQSGYVKAMWWSSLSDITPLCEAK